MGGGGREIGVCVWGVRTWVGRGVGRWEEM